MTALIVAVLKGREEHHYHCVAAWTEAVNAVAGYVGPEDAQVDGAGADASGNLQKIPVHVAREGVPDDFLGYY